MVELNFKSDSSTIYMWLRDSSSFLSLVSTRSMLSCWSSSAASMVQIIAVAARGPIVALAKLPDATTSLYHQLLWHRHHNAKEVRILKCLGDDGQWKRLGIKVITQVFQLYIYIAVCRKMCQHIINVEQG